MEKYLKAKKRIIKTSGNKNITDALIIEKLEDEIDYYRNKIEKLEQVREENRQAAKKDYEKIKEYQEILKKVIIGGEDIFTFKTPNQIRKLLGYETLDNKEEKDLDKQFEITIDNEEYLIKYNKDVEVTELNAYIIKLVNEPETNIIYKDNEFKIINKTRCEKQEKIFDNLL